MRDTLLKLTRRQDLTREETRAAFGRILAGEASEAQIGGLLLGLSAKGITAEELAGAASVMREKLLPIPRHDNEVVLDTCGTGGTGRSIFNVSTTAAILIAACGGKIVKHGGRSTGPTGSADVLETLGVRLDLTPERLRACLDSIGICFAFARNHHPALKHAAPVRASLGVPTIFNLVAPLLNPASACHQLLGVFDFRFAAHLANVLKETGSKRAWVVHADGLDEISTLGPTQVCELKNGEIREWTLDPATLGIKVPPTEALRVSNPSESAVLIRGIMDGRRDERFGAAYDIASLNAAAGLVITGIAQDLPDGLRQVARAVENGNAKRTLATLSVFA